MLNLLRYSQLVALSLLYRGVLFDSMVEAGLTPTWR
jgi:hypothetical protein